MKRIVSPKGPVGCIFQAEEHQCKGQNDGYSFGHAEFEVTFFYPDRDVQGPR